MLEMTKLATSLTKALHVHTKNGATNEWMWRIVVHNKIHSPSGYRPIKYERGGGRCEGNNMLKYMTMKVRKKHIELGEGSQGGEG